MAVQVEIQAVCLDTGVVVSVTPVVDAGADEEALGGLVVLRVDEEWYPLEFFGLGSFASLVPGEADRQRKVVC